MIVTGPLLVSSIGKLDRELRDYSESVQAIDITDAHPIDTVGAWIIYRFAERTGADIVGASEQAEVLIEAVESASSDAEIAPPRPHSIGDISEHIGIKVMDFFGGVKSAIGFLGAILAGVGGLILHPRRFRMKALVRQMELVGVTSLPIIGLMSFLIGIVIAQQGAVQLLSLIHI